MTDAYHADSALEAKVALLALANELDRTHPGAAGSLREGLDETLTVPIPPVTSRDSTPTGSTSTVTIDAPRHYSVAPRQAGQDFSGVPRTHQFLVILMVHTNKINAATTPTATSAASMTNGQPVVVIQRDAQQCRSRIDLYRR